jgi:hypothetical protein
LWTNHQPFIQIIRWHYYSGALPLERYRDSDCIMRFPQIVAIAKEIPVSSLPQDSETAVLVLDIAYGRDDPMVTAPCSRLGHLAIELNNAHVDC